MRPVIWSTKFSVPTPMSLCAGQPASQPLREGPEQGAGRASHHNSCCAAQQALGWLTLGVLIRICYQYSAMGLDLLACMWHQYTGYSAPQIDTVRPDTAMAGVHCLSLQDQQVACMDACAAEYTAKVPKMRADCQAGMKQLGA